MLAMIVRNHPGIGPGQCLQLCGRFLCFLRLLVRGRPGSPSQQSAGVCVAPAAVDRRDAAGRRRWPGPCRQHGVTLLELLAVLAISAVLLGIALPATGDMLRTYRLKLAASDLHAAVELTRGQAIATGQTVLLAPASASLSWSDGWTVFIDRNGNRRPDAGDTILSRHPPLAPGISINMHFGSQQDFPYLAYNSAGRGCKYNSSLIARFGTLTVADGRARRRIKINMLGRARLCDPARDGAQCAGDDA